MIPWKSFDFVVVIVQLKKGKWRHKLGEDIMNGMFKSREAKTNKSQVDIIDVAETDCKWSSSTQEMM